MNITRRKAVKSDNADLIELIKSSPMKGMISLYMDRFPDYFTFPELQGEEFEVYVAEHENKIIGCFCHVLRKERWNGKMLKVVYGGDLRIHPDYRRQRPVAHALRDMWIESLRESGYHHGVADMIKGNIGAELTQRFLKGVCDVERNGTVKLYQILPLIPIMASTEYEYRKATKDDTDAIRRLLTHCYHDYNGTPDFMDEFDRQCNRHPSFSIESMWVAVKSGRIVACAGLWDQEEFRRTVVMKYSKGTKWATRGFKLVGPLTGMPKLPQQGEPFKQLYIRFPGCVAGEEKALKHLIRSQVEHIRKRKKHHFIFINFHERDPLKKVLRGLPRSAIEINLFKHFPVDMDQETRDSLNQGIPWTDFSLV